MLLNVKIIPNARKSEVIKEGSSFRVRLSAPAAEGKANTLLLEVLADYFNVRKSSIRILKESKSRNKIIEVSSG